MSPDQLARIVPQLAPALVDACRRGVVKLDQLADLAHALEAFVLDERVRLTPPVTRKGSPLQENADGQR